MLARSGALPTSGDYAYQVKWDAKPPDSSYSSNRMLPAWATVLVAVGASVT